MRPTIKRLRARSGGGGGDRAEWRIRTLVRRMAVTATAAVRWTLEGFVDFDGNVETEQAEVFGVAGVASRPPSGNRAEAVVTKIGGESGHPVIVATRDHDGLKVFIAAEGLEPGETAIFTDKATVHAMADGTIRAGSLGGDCAPLATLADLEALRKAIEEAVPAANDGGAALRKAILDASWTTGTTKLRAE